MNIQFLMKNLQKKKLKFYILLIHSNISMDCQNIRIQGVRNV